MKYRQDVLDVLVCIKKKSKHSHVKDRLNYLSLVIACVSLVWKIVILMLTPGTFVSTKSFILTFYVKLVLPFPDNKRAFNMTVDYNKFQLNKYIIEI